MTNKQKKLAKKYGTPAQFSAALMKAYADFCISLSEADEAINQYEKEWVAAGETQESKGNYDEKENT